VVAVSTRLDVPTDDPSGVDLYPLQTGVGPEDVDTFGKCLGGSPTNVTGVGDDPYGRSVRREIRRYGIDDRHGFHVQELHTSVTFCEIFPPDHFPLRLHRAPSAPELRLWPQGLPTDVAHDSHVRRPTVTGLSAEMDAALACWAAAHALPTVRGSVIGRSLLSPPDGGVTLLHAQPSQLVETR
jgi:5-dehydro-2-deoxygluconokinase